MLPFARNERVQGGYERCYEGERKREIEIFEINRGYEMLVQALYIERDEKSDLHCEIEIDEYVDKTVVNHKNLPDVVINVVEEYNEKITYLVLNKNTYGDRTEITNVDRFYELIGNNSVKYYVDNGHYNNNNNNNKLKVDKNDLCYKHVRYLHDDRG